MNYRLTRGNEIQGDLEIFISRNEERYGEDTAQWSEVFLHGSPAGLKSLAKLLIQIAELNQEDVEDHYLPVGAREHYHLRPGFELSRSSVEVIVGRLDAKGTGEFHQGYVPK